MHIIGYIKNIIDYGLTYSHEFNLSLLQPLLTPTMEGVGTLVIPHQDMFLQWLGELLPGVANGRQL